MAKKESVWEPTGIQRKYLQNVMEQCQQIYSQQLHEVAEELGIPEGLMNTGKIHYNGKEFVLKEDQAA